MTYGKHLLANWAVAGKCLLLAGFHFAHGLVPHRWTSHEFWGLRFEKRG